MGSETRITILDRPKGGKPGQQVVKPSTRSKHLPRRNGLPFFTFYDLAQVNTGTVADPVWEDHDILFVPDYTSTYHLTGSNFDSQVYTVETFTDEHYAAFTAKLFAVGPVTDWKNKYRKIEKGFAWSTDSDDILSPTSPSFAMPDHFLYSDTPSSGQYPIVAKTSESYTRAESFAADNMAWTGRGVEYRNFVDMAFNRSGVPSQGWYGCDGSDKATYKITATNAPGAADVGTLTPSGNIEVYMVPQVGFWAAVCYNGSAGTGNVEGTIGQPLHSYGVLGMHYQVQPRQYFPRFVQPGWDDDFASPTDDATTDPLSRKAAYLAYQMSRDDVRSSVWTMQDDDPASNLNPITTTEAEGGWNGLSTGRYRAASDNTAADTYYSSAPANYRTVFRGTSTQFFTGSDPFLTAVIKMGGVFYYVWSIDGIHVTQTRRQQLKYILTMDT